MSNLENEVYFYDSDEEEEEEEEEEDHVMSFSTNTEKVEEKIKMNNFWGDFEEVEEMTKKVEEEELEKWGGGKKGEDEKIIIYDELIKSKLKGNEPDYKYEINENEVKLRKFVYDLLKKEDDEEEDEKEEEEEDKQNHNVHFSFMRDSNPMEIFLKDLELLDLYPLFSKVTFPQFLLMEEEDLIKLKINNEEKRKLLLEGREGFFLTPWQQTAIKQHSQKINLGHLALFSHNLVEQLLIIRCTLRFLSNKHKQDLENKEVKEKIIKLTNIMKDINLKAIEMKKKISKISRYTKSPFLSVCSPYNIFRKNFIFHSFFSVFIIVSFNFLKSLTKFLY